MRRTFAGAAAAVALIGAVATAGAACADEPIKITEGNKGNAYYYYPTYCAWNYHKSTGWKNDIKPGYITLSCPASAGFKTFTYFYGEGDKGGTLIDSGQREGNADGTVYTLDNVPWEPTGSPGLAGLWSNFKIFPRE